MASTVDPIPEGSPIENRQPAVEVADTSLFQQYLRKILPLLLEDGNITPSTQLEQCVDNQANVDTFKKFLGDASFKVLLFRKCYVKDDEVGAGGGGGGEEAAAAAAPAADSSFVYHVAAEINFVNTSQRQQSVLFTKKGAAVEAEKSIASQVRVMNLEDVGSTPYETLHNYVSNAVAPYFKSYIRATGKADTRDSDKLAPSVEKKIAELEMGLLHLQQNIEIPEVNLPIHQVVVATIKRVRESEDRAAKAEDFGALIDDSSFLNALQNGVNRWIKEIQKVTKLERDASSGTAMQEISFWLNLEKAIQKIREKLDTLEVTLTLDILKQGRRFMATLSFDTDTGLGPAIATVNDYNLLMKDFPLSDLFSATELDKLRLAIVNIFQHFKKIRNTKYPIQRCLRLVEAISRDLLAKLLNVLGSQKLMHISFEEFEKLIHGCNELFNTWDDEYEKLLNLLREQAKKKRDDTIKMAWRSHPAHKKLQTRLDSMRKFRRQHEQLRAVIARVLRPPSAAAAAAKSIAAVGDEAAAAAAVAAVVAPPAMDASADANAIEEVNLAYENVKHIDCLDVSTELGVASWDAANKRYDERIDRVEARITAKLRDQLGTAKNAIEMFRIFSRFNALFVRPHVRGAIREYQTQLIQRVKDDIEQLHHKFRVNYQSTRSRRLSLVSDLPPVSGSIIWAMQIDRQLVAYLRRVEDVLGKGWENHVEGQKLKAEGDSFRRKLNTQELFDEWAKMAQQKAISAQGRLFAVETYRVRGGGGANKQRLRVNFQPEIISLFKEVRNMRAIGYRIPIALSNKAHQANQVYPFATSLMESLRTYQRTCDKVDHTYSLTLLVASLKHDLHRIIHEGCTLNWESYKLDGYVHKFAEAVFNFQDKVDDLLIIEERVGREIALLETCEYSGEQFAEILQRIQQAVDELNLASFSNLPFWVAGVEEKVEKKLVVRLEAGLKAWTEKLVGKSQADDIDTEPGDGSQSAAAAATGLGGDPVIAPLVHEIRITNQVMHLSPCIEETRYHLLQSLFHWEAQILELPRIQSQRYQVGVEVEEAQTYKHLLDKLPNGHTHMLEAYRAVQDVVSAVHKYVKQWLSFQALWDLSMERVVAKVGGDMEKWMRLLAEIKAERTTFDRSETRKQFGPVSVDFAKVQSKVNLKYDSVHKEILAKFGSMLGGEMSDVYSVLAKSRSELEGHSIETASTAEAVQFITHVQALKRKLKSWQAQVEMYKAGQKVLERQRFQFPQNWLYADHLNGEWSSFNEVMRRKDASIQSQVASLQMKIVAEDKVVEEKTGELLGQWEKEKPTGGSMKPSEATVQIAMLEGKFTKLREERENMAKAKEALELSEPGAASRSAVDEQLQVALEELADLKGVWAELAGIWEQIDVLKDQAWLSVSPKKLRHSLELLMTQLKNMPARLRQYESYEHVQKTLKAYSKMNMMIVELKADYLKERHWKALMKRLGVSWVMTDLSLGHIWDIDLLKHEAAIKEVLQVAQGENALEEFLKQVRTCWQNYELELINYQNRTKIIRGWDDLFGKVKEHINSVQAMKLSPYYKVFEEEASGWEDKLNRVNALFDVWIDVQRRWVYLEGIFAGSADIKNLLPIETQRFQGISTEFLGLMKKVVKNPLVLDVLNIQGVQRQLERLADLLNKIQKALGEYLERERASFPRFYFVGDEDLLEIIGNSKNVQRLQKHFKKMFAGVHQLNFSEDCSLVQGVASGENEVVQYRSAVSLVKYPRINEWLTQTEAEMKMSLAKLLADAVNQVSQFMGGTAAAEIDQAAYTQWLDTYQAQLVVIAAQIAWTNNAEDALARIAAGGGGGGSADLGPLEQVTSNVQSVLSVLADSVLLEQPVLRRKKLEHMITELVHQRDVTRLMVAQKMDSNQLFDWLMQMRFYFDPNNPDPLQQLDIQMSNAHFNYGFEYLGVVDKLVQTPLTDRCYLTLTQALDGKYGGSPFGPAGTGKTESVKALGNQLGRFTLVFNCDETFDFQAMGRIFVGLCQVGAWGCFDEFNRLEEKMLSAVSQQIQAIQETLKAMGRALKGAGGKLDKPHTVELVGKTVTVNPDMAIFITMNPGYAGRSNLPDNLKKLFRAMAMTQPDRRLISQVILFSQGFRSAELLSKKVVPLFKLCQEQLSNQSHYDFGLRALKAVLSSAGTIKLDRMQALKAEMEARGDEAHPNAVSEQINEQDILITSICETMIPKLVAEDIPLMYSLLADVFPGVQYTGTKMEQLRGHVRDVCRERFLVCGQREGEPGYMWNEKIVQLYQITNLHHGLMLVGPTGSGKTCAWRTLLAALERCDGQEGVSTIIDPKAIKKDELYGSLDPNTREWTDGIFTATLRKVIDNVRGERNKRQWIIFDGDVDPEWVENLNSVLDCSKLLTLPNGERLAVPPNVRIMFEVQDLKHATLATVSRCGMVWFSEEVVTCEMVFDNFLAKLRHLPVEEDDSGDLTATSSSSSGGQDAASQVSPAIQVQREIAGMLAPHFAPADGGIVSRVLDRAADMEHVMQFTKLRVLFTLFSMLNQIARNVLKYNRDHPDFPLPREKMEAYTSKQLIYCLIFAACGDAKLKMRQQLGDFIAQITTIPLPPPLQHQSNQSIIDYEATLPDGEWAPWANRVPVIEIETHKVGSPDVVVPTLDTVRHESLLYTWLSEHRPLVLCGPPGSGKTMTLFSALRALPDMEVIGLNFSSATTPELLIKTLDQYCEYRKTPNGTVMAPLQLGQWLVLFCDEINLPDQDSYETQRVITFLRQLVEHGGFYRTSDMTWVTTQRIQMVGACNPPTDPGRKPITPRLLRHMPVVYVDYPGEMSLKQIYGTLNRAMLRCISSLKPYADPLTNAMTDFFLKTQDRFTADIQPHYIYSPREMTRWVRGIFEAIKPLESLSVEGLVRIWAHEAYRLFRDRLIEEEERRWTDENVENTALAHFPGIDREEALKGPILYSNWLSKDYLPVGQDELRDYVKARLKVFYEEELDVQLVLFNEVLDHVLRIDRVFRQPQGHVLLIGVSGAGKTTLSRFVAWMNGLTVYQIKVHNKYSGDDFDEDLRTVLRRSGCKGEKICFIMDEGNVLDASFLERMNTLLANGEVPGLFEGDEYTTLVTQIKEGAQREGLMLDSNEELYKWFTGQVMRNLHVVFTMNPSANGLKDRAATSPALFNRCVLNWFGDWSLSAYFQVGKEFTAKVDIDNSQYSPPQFNPPLAFEGVPTPLTYHNAIVNSFVFVHQSLHRVSDMLVKRGGGRPVVVTPRHFLDFINHYVRLYAEKRSELEEQQQHLSVGLHKIRETVEQVATLQGELKVKSRELEQKNALANAKLKQMVADQQNAEQKKKESEALQIKLEQMSAFIAEKRQAVMKDLANVEPAVEEAKQAVSSIKRQHLVEMRSMGNPPALVKMALESICLMLGEDVPTWKDIRQVIMKDNFIARIINYNAEKIPDEIREQMQKRYLSNPDYDFEKINRASQACGPMVKWAIAQISYAEMLKKVDPLRQELRSLEAQADENKEKATETDKLIADLEASIARYTEEYAQLISQAQTIKNDAELVEAKVTRSKALLSSLSSEKTRWEAGSETFKAQMCTIVGDVLVSSAFMAYAGLFEQSMRRTLVHAWTQHLTNSNIVFRADLALVEYLSTADERLTWQANALPADDLCVENAIMLKRYNRYPLVIDPSGQATEFIMREFKARQITKTSFLDSNFRKHLESALRFGNPLLVQDVESYDPILNPVLNREVRRTGGRVLITIGDQDIDLSPTFAIFLSTRDPTVEFAPDLCSRVTFVNFTVTRSSLQSQCLNTVLKAERPDVDEKRADLLKLQGEFRLKLRHLEKSLLAALNESKGSILEDDKVITTLETLKREASEVQRKVDETDVVMAEVDATSQQYAPLATACSNLYFTMEGLTQVHYLYQYSLHFFLQIFHAALTAEGLAGVSEPGARLQLINTHLFSITFERVSRGMLHSDRVTFAILLARIQMKGNPGDHGFDLEYKQFIEGNQKVVMASRPRMVAGLSQEQAERLAKLAQLPAFSRIYERLHAADELQAWLRLTYPESAVPELWEQPPGGGSGVSKVGAALYRLLLVEVFRPDRLLAAAHLFVSAVMGEELLGLIERPLDLGAVVEREVRCATPVLMCSVTGYDASGKVEDLAADAGGHSLTSISIGSAEGFKQADSAINQAAKTGKWVLLKNVHLAPQWLAGVEKKLHSLTPNPSFRLFLTCEITPKLPMNVVRAGRVFVFEPPPGIKANLMRTFAELPASRITRAPNERARLYFLLAWFNAIVQERLRYAPLGWSKRYEFTDSDLKCGCDLLDTWVDSACKGRANLSPDKIPWDALRTTLAQCIYGGRIDNQFDQKLLEAFLANLFTARSFDADFPLIEDSDGHGKRIMMPDGIRRDQFVRWVADLPDSQTPSWLGLPNNAETVLLTTLGAEMTSKLLKMRTLEDDSAADHTQGLDLSASGGAPDQSTQPKGGADDGRPAWMKSLAETAQQWLALVPKTLQGLQRTAENIKDPLFRFFDREVGQGAALLEDVRRDLRDVIAVCKGEKKQTNFLRQLISFLSKGMLPSSWNRYKVPASTTVLQWIADFSDRITQLKEIAQVANESGAPALKEVNVWLGGLFTAEAYITATRQYVAQANQWSLEELTLQVRVLGSDGGGGGGNRLDSCTFGILSLNLLGAECVDNKLVLSPKITTELPLTALSWVRLPPNQRGLLAPDQVCLPVYLNFTRLDLLFTLDFTVASGGGGGAPQSDWMKFYERGVALLCSKPPI